MMSKLLCCLFDAKNHCGAFVGFKFNDVKWRFEVRYKTVGISAEQLCGQYILETFQKNIEHWLTGYCVWTVCDFIWIVHDTVSMRPER